MPPFAVVFLFVFLVIYAAPVLLLRAGPCARAQDHVVAAVPTPPGVLQNASIASTLRLALFAPAFVWGARGDFLAAMLFAAAAGLGILLLHRLRRPLQDFLTAALGRDQSITVHAFIASQYGDDQRVRSVAAGLTLIALSGLLVAEAVGLTLLLKPMQPASASWACLLVGAMLAAVPLFAVPSGHSAVMQAAQAQLGMAYVGLFGSAALLLYLLLAAFRPMPPHGTLAIVGAALICIVMLAYRRSRYVDAGPIGIGAGTGHGEAMPAEPRAGRLFRRLNKVLNPILSALLVVVVVFALMGLASIGFVKVAADAVATLRQPTSLTGIELATLVLLPLCYPIADVSNWQRLAAFEKDRRAGYDRVAELQRIIGVYSAETALVLLFVVMVGAIAVIATATPAGADVIQVFIGRLAAQQNLIAVGASSLLLVGLIAIGFSTMISLFSAGLCTLHADLLPALRREQAPDRAGPAPEQAGPGMITQRRRVAVGLGFALLIMTAFGLAAALLTDAAVRTGYLAVVIAFACCQLALAPLVLGSIIGRRRGAAAAVGPQWALAILGAGASVGVGAVAVHLATGTEAWLWAAVPACLGVGVLLFGLAQVWPRGVAAKV